VSDYKIEKNVPIPKGYARTKYPFSKMEVGDSFVVEDVNYNRVRQAAYSYSFRNDIKLSVKRGLDGKFHCWRVE
jgi:hypothetical protein